MNRITGTVGVSLIECVNPMRNKWRIRWDINPVEGADNLVTYMEKEFDHKPTTEEVREAITEWYNAQAKDNIISGFAWEGVPVWLSTENQLNYASAYEMAKATEGANLPKRFKFGTDDEPKFHTFNTVEELQAFYFAFVNHIDKAVDECWEQKNAVNFDAYL